MKKFYPNRGFHASGYRKFLDRMLKRSHCWRVATSLCTQEDRREWLRERKRGVGASDAAGILGLSPWDGQPSLYVDKTTPVFDEELAVAPHIEMGNVLEEFTLEKIRQDLSGRRAGLDGTMYSSEDLPWMRATLDGWIEELDGKRTNVELKSTAFEDRWRDGVPEDVHAQVQHQMFVTGSDRMIVGVIFRVSCEWRSTEITRSDEFINDVLIPAEQKFWKKVLDKDPTGLEIDASDASRKALEVLHGRDAPESSETQLISSECDDFADEISAISDQMKELKKQQQQLKNLIADEIQDKPIGVLPSGRYFRFKTQQRKGYEVGPKTLRPLLGPFGRETTT